MDATLYLFLHKEIHNKLSFSIIKFLVSCRYLFGSHSILIMFRRRFTIYFIYLWQRNWKLSLCSNFVSNFLFSWKCIWTKWLIIFHFMWQNRRIRTKNLTLLVAPILTWNNVVSYYVLMKQFIPFKSAQPECEAENEMMNCHYGR